VSNNDYADRPGRLGSDAWAAKAIQGSVGLPPACSNCGWSVEAWEIGWVHKDPVPSGRYRFWCPDRFGTLQEIRPVDSMSPSL
jgi:hypothetical protein